MMHWTQHCSSNYSDLLLRPKVADVDPFGQQINQPCNKETKHGILEVYAGKKMHQQRREGANLSYCVL